MDELTFFAGLIAITLVVIGLLIYFGLKINKAVGKHAAGLDLPLNISWSGNILFACLVAFWICCMVIRGLRPEGSFGTFLNTPDGLAAALIGSIFIAAIAAAILEKLGYPITKNDDNS